MEKLKKCPFCGNGNIYVIDEIDWFYASCYECGAEGPTKDTYKEAINTWNKRINND